MRKSDFEHDKSDFNHFKISRKHVLRCLIQNIFSWLFKKHKGENMIDKEGKQFENVCRSHYIRFGEVVHVLIRYHWCGFQFWLNYFSNGKNPTSCYTIQAVCKNLFHLASCSQLRNHRWICLSKTKYSIKCFGWRTKLPRLVSSTPKSHKLTWDKEVKSALVNWTFMILRFFQVQKVKLLMIKQVLN